jgi:hypothetical protein
MKEINHCSLTRKREWSRSPAWFICTSGFDQRHEQTQVDDFSPAGHKAGCTLFVHCASRNGPGGGEQTSAHAATLCRTHQERILKLPDYVEVYPTHVSGSLCGGAIGSRLSSTVG